MGYAPAPISLGSSVMKLVLPQGLGCLSPGCQSGCGWDFQLTPCSQMLWLMKATRLQESTAGA
jgi:hypothetical protein